MNRIEFWFDRRAHHVRERHAEGAATHEVRHDAQCGKKDSETKKKNRKREPFNAAEVSGDFRLRCRINRLKKSFAENSVIDNRPIHEPAETWRSIDLTTPFRSPSRAESNDATSLLKSPAKIDIVAGLVVLGIEAANVFKCPPIERHVTTGNVF